MHDGQEGFVRILSMGVCSHCIEYDHQSSIEKGILQQFEASLQVLFVPAVLGELPLPYAQENHQCLPEVTASEISIRVLPSSKGLPGLNRES